MKRQEFPRSTAVFVGLVLLAELVARVLVAPAGRLWSYWEPGAALKFEYFASRVASLRAVVVGDSTAGWNIQPAALQAAAGWQGEVLNVGQAGNPPAAFRCSTLPILETASRWPGVVIVSFAPGAFTRAPKVRRIGAGILDSPLCRSLAGEVVVQDWVHLTRLRGVRQHAYRLWTGGPLLPPPPEGGYAPPGEAMLGGDSGPAAVAPGTPRPVGRAVDPESFSLLERLAELAAQRRARLVVLLPPMIPDWAAYEDYTSRLFALSRASTVVEVVDWRDRRSLDRSDFADGVHLNREGAARFSRLLGARLADKP